MPVEPTITISISIVCSPEQLAHIQPRVSALQADLHRLGVAFSVGTHHHTPPRPSMSLEEAQRDPQAFLAGFAETERSIHFDPELARRQRDLLGSTMAEQPPAGFRRHRFLEASIDLPEHLSEAQLDGRACIRCGHEAEPGEAMRPVEAWSELSAQLFECGDSEACGERVTVESRRSL